MSDNMVSTADLERHYELHRWRLELGSSQRFRHVLIDIANSGLDARDRSRVTNVVWALASFERAHAFLIANLRRADRAQNEGVPPAMAFLSGPYKDSLDVTPGT